MAFKRFRRYAKKAGRYARRYVKNRYGTPGGVGRLIKDVSMLKTALNVERKYHTRQAFSERAITAAAPYAWHPWDALTVGTSEIQRTGDQVKALWTNIRMDFENSATELSASASMKVRVMVILDNDTRFQAALDPIVLRDQILYDGLEAKGAMLSGYKVVNTVDEGAMGERYKVLRDIRFELDNVQKKNKYLNISINHTRGKYKGMKLRYTNVTNNPNPRLYVLVLTDNSGTAGALYTNWYARTCFVDN